MTARALQPNYLLIGIWLAGLMLAGVFLSELSGGWLPLPHAAVIVIVLALSMIKALLVACYFMHLQSDSRLFALVAVVPLVLLVLVLGLLFSSKLVRF